MAESTIDSLYEDLEDPVVGGTLNLIPDGLVDPEESDEDEDDDDYIEEDDLFRDKGDDFEPDDELDETTEGDNKSKSVALTESTIINELLKAKGIDDPKAIIYENEDGETEELDFYNLPYEDQLQILKHQEAAPINELSDHENEVVNFLRTQKTTLDDVIEFVKREAIEEYERESSGKAFIVDDYKDEELFIMDLKLNYEDLDEAQLQVLLEKELEHEDIFKKKVAKIRSQYIDLEVKERESTETKKLETENLKFEELSTNLIEAAINLEDIGGINLEDIDKNIVLSSVLEKDLNGKTDFNKRLDDPKILFKAAWFIEKGDEAFSMIHEYYKKQIDTVRKSAYEKGKTESNKGTSDKGSKTSYTRTGQNRQTTSKGAKTIDDLL